MNVGNAIKQARKSKKISQTALAENAGIAQTSLSQIENGLINPHQSTIDKICASLNIPKLILYFMAADSNDVPNDKKQLFEDTYPSIKELCIKLFSK